jgi:hypothetical protein
LALISQLEAAVVVMNIIVKIKDKSIQISCGKANQDLAWLALASCYEYGQLAFPKGNYLPSLLTTLDGEIPHPRKSIRQVLTDRQEVIVLLKDPRQEVTEDQVEWYSQAYGPLRNMMMAKFTYIPFKIDFKEQANVKVGIKVFYQMFAELTDEFSREEFPERMNLLLEPIDDNKKTFIRDILLPYGDIIKVRVYVEIPNRSDAPEIQDLNETEQQRVSCYTIPEPISQAKRQSFERDEEEAHRKREDEAARVAQEQLIAAKMPQQMPSKTLHDIWPEAPERLGRHFPMLYDIFIIYANFHVPEEDQEFISAHDLFHLFRTFELVTDRDDLFTAVLELEGLFEEAIENVLKPMISLQKYLEILVGMAKWRSSADEALDNVIDKLNSSKMLWMQDTIKSEMLKPELSELFMDNSDLLSSLYSAFCVPAEAVKQEMKTEDFLRCINSSAMLREVVTDEMLESVVDDALSFSSAGEGSGLFYVDFLEVMIRLATVVPFSEEDIEKTLTEQPDTVLIAEKVHSIIRLVCGSATRTPSVASRGAITSRGTLRPVTGASNRGGGRRQ